MYQRQSRMAVLLILLLLVVGCASVPLTPDQSARAAISKAQGQWNVWFDAANSYYAIHPEKQTEWQNTVIPVFQEAKNELQQVSNTLQAGKIDTLSIINMVEGITNSLLNTLIRMGVLK